MEKEDLAKIGSDKAKAEWQARKDMAKVDESDVYSKERVASEHLQAEAFDNFALYNWILTSQSFTHCKTTPEVLHQFFKYLMVHMERVVKDYKELRRLSRYLSVGGMKEADLYVYNELMSRNPDPSEIAMGLLKQVQDAAKNRSKLNKYGVVTGKKVEAAARSEAVQDAKEAIDQMVKNYKK
jgi:hypothetical protein